MGVKLLALATTVLILSSCSSGGSDTVSEEVVNDIIFSPPNNAIVDDLNQVVSVTLTDEIVAAGFSPWVSLDINPYEQEHSAFYLYNAVFNNSIKKARDPYETTEFLNNTYEFNTIYPLRYNSTYRISLRDNEDTHSIFHTKDFHRVKDISSELIEKIDDQKLYRDTSRPTFVEFTNNVFVGIDKYSNKLFTSKDGIDWSVDSLAPDLEILNLMSGNGYFIYVAIDDKDLFHLFRSANGVNWDEVSLNNTSFIGKNIKYVNDRFIIVGEEGGVYQSFDGGQWSFIDLNTIRDLCRVFYSNEKYYITECLSESTPPLFFTSSDLVNWDSVTINSPGNVTEIYSLFHNGSTYIAYGDYAIFTPVASGAFTIDIYGFLLTSLDGINWDFKNIPFRWSYVHEIFEYKGNYFGVSDNKFVQSSDGLNWISIPLYYYDIAIGNDSTIGAGDTAIGRTIDGLNWDDVYTSDKKSLKDRFFITSNLILNDSDDNIINTSLDGKDWHEYLLGEGDVEATCMGNGIDLAVGSNGLILTIDANNSFAIENIATNRRLNTCHYANGTYLVAGEKGLVALSKDGKNWTIVDSGIDTDAQDISFYNNQFVIASGTYGAYTELTNDDKGIIITSSDGVNWIDASKFNGPDPDTFYTEDKDKIEGLSFSRVISSEHKLVAFDRNNLAVSSDTIDWINYSEPFYTLHEEEYCALVPHFTDGISFNGMVIIVGEKIVKPSYQCHLDKPTLSKPMVYVSDSTLHWYDREVQGLDELIDQDIDVGNIIDIEIFKNHAVAITERGYLIISANGMHWELMSTRIASKKVTGMFVFLDNLLVHDESKNIYAIEGGVVQMPPSVPVPLAASIKFFDKAGEGGHAGYIDVQGSPISGSSLLEISTHQELSSVTVDVITSDSVKETYMSSVPSFVSGGAIVWKFLLEIPVDAFVVNVTGKDVDGEEYLFTSDEYRPPTYKSRLSSEYPVLTYGVNKFELSIENYGSDREFNISIVNSSGYEVVTSILPDVLVLNNEQVVFPFEVIVPKSATTGSIQFDIHISAVGPITGAEVNEISPLFNVIATEIPLYPKDPYVEYITSQCDNSLYPTDEFIWMAVAGDHGFDVSSILYETINLNAFISPVEISIVDSISYIPSACPSVADGIPDLLLKFSASDIYALSTVIDPNIIPVTLHFSAPHLSGGVLGYSSHELITLH